MLRPHAYADCAIFRVISQLFFANSMAIALGIIGPGREDALKSHDGLTDYGLAFELTDKPLLVIVSFLLATEAESDPRARRSIPATGSITVTPRSGTSCTRSWLRLPGGCASQDSAGWSRSSTSRPPGRRCATIRSRARC